MAVPNRPVGVLSDTITPPCHRSTPFPAWVHPHSTLLQGPYQCLILTGSICKCYLLTGLDDLHLPFLDHETSASHKHSMHYARTQCHTPVLQTLLTFSSQHYLLRPHLLHLVCPSLTILPSHYKHLQFKHRQILSPQRPGVQILCGA